MQNLNFQLLLNILENQLRFQGENKSGIYNERQDATAFSKSVGYVYIEQYPKYHEEEMVSSFPGNEFPMGGVVDEGYLQPAGWYPEPVILKINLNDCTWGIDIIISEVIHEFEEREIVKDYFDSSDKKLCRGTDEEKELLQKEIERILTEGEFISKDEMKRKIAHWTNYSNVN